MRDTKNKDRQRKYTTWAVSEFRRKIKARAIAYKGGACNSCGYAKCPAALQFHHLDPTRKDFQISGNAKAWEKIVVELDKTVMVCANCHFELHHEESERQRVQQELEVRVLVPVRVPAPHGSSRYTMGCRCPKCKAGHATRLREYKSKKKVILT